MHMPSGRDFAPAAPIRAGRRVFFGLPMRRSDRGAVAFGSDGAREAGRRDASATHRPPTAARDTGRFPPETPHAARRGAAIRANLARRVQRARAFAAALCTIAALGAHAAVPAPRAGTSSRAGPPASEPLHVIAPERPEVRRLGESVAADGDLLAIAAPTDGDDALEPGQVFVYRASATPNGSVTLGLKQALRSHATGPGDHFGASVAVVRSCRGAGGADFIAVGADRATVGAVAIGFAAGSVELFECESAAAGAWRLAARLSAREPEPAASFGSALAFDRDGSARLVVGAPRHDAVGAFDAGRVHVFRREAVSPTSLHAGRWAEVATITPPSPGTSAWFGSAVAMEGDLLAVGSPGLSVAARGASEPTQGAGGVYVFRRVGTSGANDAERYRFERLLVAPVPEHAAWFGLSIDLDGGVLSVGAPRARAATGGVIGEASPIGCVYLYELNQPGAPPKRIDPPAGVATYGFGQAIALRAGNLVVGAPSTDAAGAADPTTQIEDAGAAWIYSLPHGAYTATLIPPRSLPSSLFGASCALSIVRRSNPQGALGLAIVGHRYVEEESVAQSPGAAIYRVPRAAPPP